MQRIPKLQSQLTKHRDLAIKAVSFQILPILMIGSQLLVILLTFKIGFFPGEEVMLSIIGTCAQIIAGLYGITMAGYTFFLSRIDAITAADATLDYVTGSIKKRFQYLIWYLTVNVLMTLLISIVLMYCPVPDQKEMNYLYRFFCNEFLLFMIFSIALILYYSILVIDPNAIRKEAAKLKRRLGGMRPVPGDVVEFLSLYDQIRQRCNAMLPEAVLNQLAQNKGSHFELTLKLLEVQYPRLQLLVRDLTRIHRYYECVINSTPLSVSLEMCLLAKKVLFFLEQSEQNQLLRMES